MTLRSLSALAAALGLIISTAAFAQSGSSGGSGSTGQSSTTPPPPSLLPPKIRLRVQALRPTRAHRDMHRVAAREQQASKILDAVRWTRQVNS